MAKPRRTSTPSTEKLAEQIKKGRSARPAREYKSLVPTGSTLLNLACSDKGFHGGFGLGTMVNLIGDSHAGKTLLAWTLLATCAQRRAFKDYRFIYDEPEVSFKFNIKDMFGSAMVGRVEQGIKSHTILEFHANVLDALEKGKPCIYILDSLDSLTTDAEISKAEEKIDAMRKGKEAKGSYGMSKAKEMSELFRMILRRIEETNSILIIISQTRQNISPISMAPKVRSGGDALRFYSSHEIWLAVRERIKSRGVIIGSVVKAKITKNKITGKSREILFPVLNSYGVDDIESCISYLVQYKAWKESDGKIVQSTLGLKGTRQAVIKAIEEDSLYNKLADEVERVWLEFEESLKPKRAPRFK